MPAGPACPTCHRKGTYSPKFGTCSACADEKALRGKPKVAAPARKPAAKKAASKARKPRA